MAGIRKGIIKRSDVQASGARSPEATLLGSALRIPKDYVRVEQGPDEATAMWQANPLFRRGLTATASEPVMIRTRPVEPIQHRRPQQAEEVETPPELTPEEIEAAWKVRLEEAREAAFAEGRVAGHTAARSEFDAEVAELKHQFAQDLDAIQTSWSTFLHRHEPNLVQLAFRLSRTVIDSPLPDEVRQISERTVADAVERMAADVAVEIILHPVSYLRMQETGVENQLNAIHSKLRWRTNADLKQNEWIVQSPRAATRRIEDELIEQLQRELVQRDDVRTDGRDDVRTDGRDDVRTDGRDDVRTDGRESFGREDSSSPSPSPSSSE